MVLIEEVMYHDRSRYVGFLCTKCRKVLDSGRES